MPSISTSPPKRALRGRAPARREVLQGLAGTALAAPSATAAASTPGFVVIGDWGRDGGAYQSQVAAAMGRAAAEINSRFVVSVGDNFYPAGVDSVDDPQWKTSFEQIYTARALQTPWYVALGNHDYRGIAQAQVDYSRISRRWRMPTRYYKVSGAQTGIPGLEIFVIDTTPMLHGMYEPLTQLVRGHLSTEGSDRQINWLKASLKASRARWKIVVGHHPIHSGGHHGDTQSLASAIKPLLAAHGVQAYLAGHDHAMQYIQRDGVAHICTGSGSSGEKVHAVEGTRFHSERPGFALVTLSGASLNLEFRDFAGRTMHRAALGRQGA